MPRLLEAKKDVISCEKPRVSANNSWSVDIRMGQPIPMKSGCFTGDRKEQTLGTETSKYQEEEKTKVISRVVASEMELAQTMYVSAYMG